MCKTFCISINFSFIRLIKMSKFQLTVEIISDELQKMSKNNCVLY